ncbi:MAG: metallophosphoesterase family protein [Chloroflexota bacterium]
MRFALLADIHGNSIALDAVLEDVRSRGGTDGYLFLGDLAAMGPDPIGVLERATSLEGARFVRGNTDRYIVTGERPDWYRRDASHSESDLRRLDLAIATSLAWTQGVVTAAGWYDWLAALPSDLRIELPDGTRLLAVHASHRRDDDPSLRPTASDDELRELLADAGADLVCAGHTHRAMDRRLGPKLRVVNPGSLSNPLPSEPEIRAGYALLDARVDGYTVELHRVDYDHDAFAESLRRVHHPEADRLIGLQRGSEPVR